MQQAFDRRNGVVYNSTSSYKLLQIFTIYMSFADTCLRFPKSLQLMIFRVKVRTYDAIMIECTGQCPCNISQRVRITVRCILRYLGCCIYVVKY